MAILDRVIVPVPDEQMTPEELALVEIMENYSDDNPPGVCLLCGSQKLTSETPTYDSSKYVTVITTCDECGASWWEEYVFDGITSLTPGTRPPVPHKED